VWYEAVEGMYLYERRGAIREKSGADLTAFTFFFDFAYSLR
jgi:hypothetical protein